MKNLNKIKATALAVALLAGSQSAHAVTPWQSNDGFASNYGTPDVTIYTSGGAAQDTAFYLAVKNILAEPGTLDTFDDYDATKLLTGSRFTGFYFIGKSTLPATLAGKKIYFEKRSLGAAGYGVVPLQANLTLDHLNIFTSIPADGTSVPANQAAAWVLNTDVTPSDPKRHQATIATIATGQTSWKNYIDNTGKSHGGFAGVDAEALLQPTTANYPATTTEVSTGLATAGWVTTLKAADLTTAGITRVPTGGLVYGIGVTQDLYKVLQAAQYLTGALPADTYNANPLLNKIGKYDDPKYLPSLSRNFLAALLSGKINSWHDVKVVDQAAPTVSIALDNPSILSIAGVTAPNAYTVGVGRRGNGAAVGAVAYAKILNYPFTLNAAPPASASAASSQQPQVRSASGVKGSANLLIDWQNGTNNSALNPTGPTNNAAPGAAPNLLGANAIRKLWGIAVNTADQNNDLGDPWRYIRIDGYAPTISNVASGVYPYWAEGEVLIRPALAAAENDLLTEFAKALNSSALATSINPTLVQPWGQPGVFATTQSDSATPVVIPFNPATPIIGLSHFKGTNTHLGVVPTPFNQVTSPATTATNIIELK